jgi:O-antigen ligase
MQAICWVFASMLVASGYTTLNRTIWVGFAAELVLIGAFVLFREKAPWTTRAKVFAGTFALAIAAGTVTMVLNIHAQREALGAIRGIEQDARLALWPEIIERVEQRPLTGYGFGRGLLRDSLREELGNVDAYLWHAHNIMLEALLQLGVPGLLLFLFLLAAILREGWRLARDSDTVHAACGVALIVVVAGMLVRNMTDTLLVRQNALLYWGIVGALLGLGERWRASG